MGDHGVILGGMPTDFGCGAGPRGELLIAHPQLAVVEGMFGHEVAGQGNAFGWIKIVVDPVRLSRIVGGHIRDVHEERLIFSVRIQKANCLFAKEIAGVLPPADMVELPGSDHLYLTVAHLDLSRLRIGTGRVEVARRHIPVVIHPAEEDLAPCAEAALIGSRAIVPLARPESRVAGFAQHLTEECMLLGNLLTAIIQMEQCPSCHQHGPAGHAHSRRGPAHNVGLRKSGSPIDQAIHVRCRDARIAQSADRVEALIVREEEEHIRSTYRHGPTTGV